MAIEKVSTGNSRFLELGLDPVYYTRDGAEMHLQDLTTAIAVDRAQKVRDQLKPLSAIIRAYNKRAERLGEALGELNKLETLFDSDAQGGKASSEPLSGETAALLSQMGYSVDEGAYPTKAEVQEYLQSIKSAIDAIQNRLQTLMNQAQHDSELSDGSYKTASDLLDALVKSQSNLIAGIGS